MSDSNQILAAAADEDLRQRMVALAAKSGVQAPEQWVDMHRFQLVATDLDGDGAATDSIATVYDYARVTYQPSPRPGQNLAAVTDSFITSAIERVLAATTKPEEAQA